jgi:signal transduction histidine kinase
MASRKSALKATLVMLVAMLAWTMSSDGVVANERLSLYAYSDTRTLVSLVEDAAALIARDGEGAFKEFGQKDSRWFNDDYYVFVYTLDGVCAFHPITPELIGKNIMALRDLNGKPLIREITDIGRKPEDGASGWVFYLWQDRIQLSPAWKSAFVRKVKAPDGQIYVVGSGSFNIKVEKIFVERRVSSAADLLASAGKDEAFKQFRDPASRFVFLDSYIFVLDQQGRTLVDPAFPTMAGRNLSEFQDAVGFYAIRDVLKKLAQADEARVLYLWPKPGSTTPSRKLIYARKVVVGGETLVVGSEFFLATPIWMKAEDSVWLRNPPG